MNESRKLLILGLGVSGRAAAELALHRGAQVTVLDEGGGGDLIERAASLEARGAEVCLEWNDASGYQAADLAVISPGIPVDSRLGHLANELTCPVISELEYGFRYASCPLLAVTGTNGKSTTVELLNYCLQQAGYRSAAAGNIGIPICEAVLRHGILDYLVVEVSSYQLEMTTSFTPLTAALLNLSPDHIDRYVSVEEYYRAKMRMFRNMKFCHQIVLRNDLTHSPLVTEAAPPGPRDFVTFTAEANPDASFYLSADGNLCIGRQGDLAGTRLCHRGELRLKGKHNIENVLAALGVAHATGLDVRSMVKGIKSFPPKPHRLELVGVHAGIQFINDSKSTNPDSLIRALEAMGEDSKDKKIVLLAGGLDKDLDFSGVEPYLSAYVKEVLIIGKAREKLMRLWGRAVSCKIFASLASAFAAALESAKKGDTVLLSPGCASQDMFKDFADRGNQYCELIKRSFGE